MDKIQNNDTGLSVRTALNTLIADSNRPTFNPASITLTDKETYFAEYTQSGGITIATPTNNFGVGASFMVLITTDGSAINFPESWGEVDNDYATDSDTYLLVAVYNGNFWAYSVRLMDVTVIPSPLIQSGSVAADNTYIDVVFNTGIYGADDGSTEAALSDFTVTFTQGAGSATAWTPSTATKTTGSALTGGETTVRINGTATGTPDGNETLEVTPADGASLYSSTGEAMAADQTTGAESLTDQTIPDLNAPTLTGLVVDSDTEITASWTDTNTSPNEVTFTLEHDTVNTFDSGDYTEVTGIAQDATSYQITGLTAETQYYVRVKAVGDGVNANTSAWSSILNDTTDSSFGVVSAAYQFLDFTLEAGGDASSVSSVIDRSGNGRTATTAASSTDPVIDVRTINSQSTKTLTLNGGSYALDLGYLFSALRSGNSEIWIAMECTGFTASSTHIFGVDGKPDGDSDDFVIQYLNDVRPAFGNATDGRASGQFNAGIGADLSHSVFRFVLDYTLNVIDLYLDGVKKTSLNISAFDPNNYDSNLNGYLGAINDGVGAPSYTFGTPANLYVTRFAAYNRKLDSSEASAVQSYMTI